MSIQPTLPIAGLVEVATEPEMSIQERFDAFHAANPWVADSLEALVADWLANDNSRVGMKQMVEVVRWEYGRRTKGDEFRLNNNYTSRYARLLIARHPEWADAIEVRELRAA